MNLIYRTSLALFLLTTADVQFSTKSLDHLWEKNHFISQLHEEIKTKTDVSCSLFCSCGRGLQSRQLGWRIPGWKAENNAASSPCTYGGLPPSGCQTPAAAHTPCPGWFCRRHIWVAVLRLWLLSSVLTWPKAFFVCESNLVKEKK